MAKDKRKSSSVSLNFSPEELATYEAGRQAEIKKKGLNVTWKEYFIILYNEREAK
jgi:hypothetical protein